MLSSLHPQMMKGMELLPKDVPIAILTRHSIREEAENGFASYDVPLTQEGVQLAEALGRAIEHPIHRVFSSPVQRCIDTAQAMIDGADVQIDIEQTKLLVEPGSYVQEIEKVAGLFFKLGPLKFANKHLRGEVRGVLSPKEGTKRILDHIQSNSGAPGSISIHVTHDTILAAFVYSLLGVSEIDDSHWPWMMEATFIWFADESVHWIWRGDQYHFDLKNFN